MGEAITSKSGGSLICPTQTSS